VVARVLRNALVSDDVGGDAVIEFLDETDAARLNLGDARAGDSLVLPVHGATGRAQVNALLDRLQAQGWTAGDRIPEPERGGPPSVA